MKTFFFISISLFLFSCNHATSDDTSKAGIFALYLLQDSTLSPQNACTQPIENLALQSSAFLNVNNLKSYVWTTHAFELTDQARSRYDQYLSSHRTVRGVPFVVTVGNDRIYLGTFWWAYSSMMPPACAVIEVMALLPFTIQLAQGAVDKRSDPRIYSSLKKSGILAE